MLTTSSVAVTTGDNYFSVLRNCVIASFVLLIAASAMRLPPWVAMLGGGAPLVYYHLGYLTPRGRKGLSQNAIDSVYYFGFLVTIAALGVSAVSLAVSGGKEPLNNIAFQFGLGLLATGYAVLARMHLTSISAFVDEASPEAVLDRYVQRSRELVTNVELASAEFVELTNKLMLRSQEVADTARMTTEKAMLNLAGVFDEQLRSTLASAREGLTEIRGLMNETSFVQEREELVRSVKVTLENVTALNKALADFAQHSTVGARTSYEVASASSALNETLTIFQANLERIGGKEGQMLTSARSLVEAQAVVADSTKALSHVVQELEGMTGTVSGIGLTFKNIKSLTTKANEQMEGLVNTAERLDGATARLASSAAVTDALAAGIERTSAALPALGERAKALDTQLASLTQTVASADQHLGGLPRPVNQAINLSTDLEGALQSVAQMLATVSAEAKTLAGHSTEHTQSLEQARQLARDVGTLQTTTQSLQAMLGGLSSTVQGLHDNLSASTGALKTAVETATTSLERDVQRSTNVARLFGERMGDVAQIIIDRTREGRPA